MLSKSEENYLKTIWSLCLDDTKGASTNAIAKKMETKASSVTDMVKKLADKDLVNYKKYHGVTLTVSGKNIAVGIIRKHRLWEVFLLNHLHFKWDEVHDIAEQLEHIQSKELTKRLDEFLGTPRFDPHGDPIPDAEGNITDNRITHALSDLLVGETAIIVGVNDSSATYLRYLDGQNLVLGTSFTVVEVYDFDHSMQLKLPNKELTVSHQVSQNLVVKKVITDEKD